MKSNLRMKIKTTSTFSVVILHNMYVLPKAIINSIIIVFKHLNRTIEIKKNKLLVLFSTFGLIHCQKLTAVNYLRA